MLLTTLVSGSLLGGCGFMHRHLDRKNDEYKRAVESRPLEVPPDLDTPSSSGALTVPAVSGRATTAAASTNPPGAAPASVTPPEASATPGATISGDGLAVSDTVASTWSRVGLALERSGVATITGRDEAGHAYTVETTGQTTTKPGWFKRAITFGHAGNKTTARVQLSVRVSADGAGSRVSVEGSNDDASRDAARSLLNSLRERLS
ncbi:hypothetical protein [Dokdonella sp.]|uniref:hypothetical protein n=1 Tax=Dokdonella sp. TaxID=2291710 RepID=UPI0037841091